MEKNFSDLHQTCDKKPSSLNKKKYVKSNIASSLLDLGLFMKGALRIV